MSMEDLLLSWRNIWRNPRRSTLTILAVFFATGLLVFMLSFQFGAYDDMISSSVRLSTGHLQVQARGYNERPNIRKSIENPKKLFDKVMAMGGVESGVMRSETSVLAAGAERSSGMLITGVHPDAERKASSLPEQIKQGRYLRENDRGVAVIGALAAEKLKIGLGDECTLLGQAKDGSIAAAIVEIIGIYRTGIDELDRTTMQVELSDFDTIFGMEGSVHRIVFNMLDLQSVSPLVETLTKDPDFSGLQVLSWDALSPGLKQSIELDLIGGVIMYAILIVVVAFSILNTFFMAIFERTREFGVLMSIGTKPGRLIKIIMAESMAMTMIGVCPGILAGVGVTLIFSHYGIGMGESAELMTQYGFKDRMYPKLSVLSVVTGPAVICVVTFVTAAVPALKIPGMKPVEALKSC